MIHWLRQDMIEVNGGLRPGDLILRMQDSKLHRADRPTSWYGHCARGQFAGDRDQAPSNVREHISHFNMINMWESVYEYSTRIKPKN